MESLQNQENRKFYIPIYIKEVGIVLPKFIMSAELSCGAKLLFGVLAALAYTKNYCWPSKAYLSKKVGCSLNSIYRYTKELISAGFLSIKLSNNGKTSLYYLYEYNTQQNADIKPRLLETNATFVPKFDDSSLIDDKDNLYRGDANLAWGDANLAYKEYKVINTNNTNNTPGSYNLESGSDSTSWGCVDCNSSQTQIDNKNKLRLGKTKLGNSNFWIYKSYLDYFIALWNVYPRANDRIDNVGHAVRMFNKVAEQNQLPTLQQMLTAIDRFKNTSSWQKGYIPALGNWLYNLSWQSPLSANEEKEIRQEKQRVVDQQLSDTYKEQLEQDRIASITSQNSQNKCHVNVDSAEHKIGQLWSDLCKKFNLDSSQQFGYELQWRSLYNNGICLTADKVTDDQVRSGFKAVLQNCEHELRNLTIH